MPLMCGPIHAASALLSGVTMALVGGPFPGLSTAAGARVRGSLCVACSARVWVLYSYPDLGARMRGVPSAVEECRLAGGACMDYY